MGIKGLNNYVDKHQLKIAYNLHNTKLIIDGNTLSKYLFYSSPPVLQHKFFYGGDYADLKAHMIAFFDKLAHCKVEPIVIFDGCTKMQLEPAARLKVLQANFAQRLRKMISICERPKVDDPKNQTFAWPSVSTVLFQVLRDLDIVHRQCVTKEADDIIPVIARYYRCPVLTIDSDFLLWDLPGGVISIYDLFEKDLNLYESSFDFEYIKCSINYREVNFLAHLESKYDFKREMLPLIGPLLGYDHVDDQIANRFAGQAARDQLKTLIESFRTRIDSKLQQFESQFSSHNGGIIANKFARSIIENLDNSIDNKHFASVSVFELKKVEKSLAQKLELFDRNQNYPEIEHKLNELERKFIGEFSQFKVSVQEKNFNLKHYPWYHDRPPAVFRWLSSQPSFDEAKEKLGTLSAELKWQNMRKIQKNLRYNENSKVFENTEFDRFVRHVKKEIPLSLLYESLEAKIRNLEPDLPIEKFLSQMHNDFFPQAPGIPLVFHRDLVNGITNPYLLNILYLKVEQNAALIENYKTLSSSSYECKFELDSYIYGIILNQDETQTVTRIYHEGTEQLQVQVQPKFVLNGKRLPSLEQISNMAKKERRVWLFLIMQCACFNEEVKIHELNKKIQQALAPESESIRDAMLLMILSLIMFTQKCSTELKNSPKWKPFLSAMLTNIFFVGYIGKRIDSSIPSFLNLNQDGIALLRNRFIDPNPVSSNDFEITHYFNCYHNCLQSFNFLTQLFNLYECFQLDPFVCGLQGSFVNAFTNLFLNGETCFESILRSMNLPNAINELLFYVQNIVM